MNSSRRLPLAIRGAILVSLPALTGCVESKHGFSFSFSSDSWPERAERTDTRELKLVSGQTLRAGTPYGEIHVRGTTNATGSMRATLHTFGRTVDDARARLDRAKVVAEETESGIALRLDFTSDPTSTHGEPTPTVDFDIDVPAGIALALESSSGNVRAEAGPFGPSRLSSSYGNVQLDHARGDVSATSSSGSVAVAFVAGGALEATSGYGPVSIADVEGGAVSAKSSSGNVSALRIRAEVLKVESGYGSLSLREIAVEGDVRAESKSGDVAVENAKSTCARYSSNYGSIRVKRSEGLLEALTSSGNIAIEDAHGELTAKTGYGTVTAEGVFTDLVAESKSGNVKVRARPGSQLSHPWSLESSYGAVALEAPKDLRFDLSAKTGYGKIDLGYALELAPGTLGEGGRSIEGKVNGGGPAVRLESKSGNVSIRPDGH